MKKILLTTTALTMLAGAAVAEISLSGSGRIGVTSTGGVTAVTHRFRVNFNASGETDGGLTFGAYVRANMNGGGVGAIGAPRLWIGNGTMTMTVGNAGGAVATNGNIWGCSVGFTGNCADQANSSFSWVSHSSGGAGASVVRLDFAMGSANISLSGGNASGGAANDTEFAVKFSMGAATVGVSFDNGAVIGTTAGPGSAGRGGTQVNIGFDAGSANIGVKLARDNEGNTGATATVSYGMGSGTLYAFAGNTITNVHATPATFYTAGTVAVYGVSYSQSLGGGASALVSVRSVGGTVTTDAGVKFSF